MMPAEALAAATLNAACALQCQDSIGSLEVGKKADIIIFDVPNHDFLAYHFGVNLVSKVIKKGKIKSFPCHYLDNSYKLYDKFNPIKLALVS